MSIHNQGDYDLIKQYLAGDSSSLEYLINRHKNKVFSYIIMIVKKQELAEDIFQDTFIKVIKSLHSGKYSEEGRFVSWVMRIAHNLIIDFYRKNKRFKTISDTDTEVSIFNSVKFSDKNVEDDLVSIQINSDLHNIVDQLPEEQKEVVVLRYYKNLSFKEIAEQTNVSINTALGRMRYAVLNMRKIMEESNINLAID